MSYSINPFTGKFDRVGVNFIQSKKTPTTSDNKYNLGTEIINTVSHKIYKLKSVISGSANWEEIGAGGVDFKSDVKSIVDCTAVPPTEVVGDRYIINNAGAVNAAWDGASSYDIVHFDGSLWIADTPTSGAICYVTDEAKLYIFSASWLPISTAIPDATTTTKGVASFAALDFSVSSGAVSLNVHNVAWSTITTTTQAVINSGYLCNNAVTRIVLTLPVLASVGDIVRIGGLGIAGWELAQNASQTVYMDSLVTTTGITGKLQSTATRDSIELICFTANQDWQVISSMGNISVV